MPDSRISNVLGTPIFQWVINQVTTRSVKNSVEDQRDTRNLIYLANKTAWFRIVSSVRIPQETYDKKPSQTYKHFNELYNIKNEDDLAKKFVLFAGTSAYTSTNESNFTYSLEKNPYGILGTQDQEVQDYGYRPFPGITSVQIDTQGKLGSIRSAQINFKVWDKQQLDVMDALYFKLGYTMFLEWGNTYYYKTGKEDLFKSEEYSIDPFSKTINTKEEIQLQIYKNVRNSEGNYDGMLGIVTNFNFTFNQEGGYDCTLKIQALGALGDSIKINHPSSLPNIYLKEIKDYIKNEKDIIAQDLASRQANAINTAQKKLEEDLKGLKSILQYLNSKIEPINSDYPYSQADKLKIYKDAGILNSSTPKDFNLDVFTQYDKLDFIKNNTLFLQKFGVAIPNENIDKFVSTIVLNKEAVLNKITEAFYKYNALPTAERTVSDGSPVSYPIDYLIANKTTIPPLSFKQGWSKLLNGIQNGILSYIKDNSDIAQNSDLFNRMYSLPIYYGNNNDSYGINIQIFLPQDVVYKNRDDRFKKILENILNKESFEFTNFTFEVNENDNKKFYLVLTGESKFEASQRQTVDKKNYTLDGTTTTSVSQTLDVGGVAKFNIIITDTSLIESVTINQENKDVLFLEYVKKIREQDIQNLQLPNTEVRGVDSKYVTKAIKDATEYQSALEIMLKGIQIRSLNQSLKINTDRNVYEIDLTLKNFDNDIFSEGVFSNILGKLKEKTAVSDSVYSEPMSKADRFLAQAKYGFNYNLMSGIAKPSEVPLVDFKELLKSYVLPYDINSEIEGGLNTPHPVYIPFGLLLMMINHSCVVYDQKIVDGVDSALTPMVYLDFNPNTNFCLTNAKQLSSDITKFLIPFQGTNEDYSKLFEDSILDKSNPKDYKIVDTKVPIWKPETEDFVSKKIPAYKYYLTQELKGPRNSVYQGRLMYALVNVEYAAKVVSQFSYRDGSNSVYLKELIEQILMDMNKCLGDFNLFRLSYNDPGNTFVIVDDQQVPVAVGETQVTAASNSSELPIFGKSSVVKSIELRTDISNKLNSLLAISANSTPDKQVGLSTDASSFGFINTDFQDRYITITTDIKGNSKEKKSNNEAEKGAAEKFDAFVQSIYKYYDQFSTNAVNSATNYFIEKMSIAKNKDLGSRSSAIIPVSLNISMDGLSGFQMTQLFTISDKFLPYNYLKLRQPNPYTSIGFAIVGLSNTIENNQWTTSIRTNMAYLKNSPNDFDGVVRSQLSDIAAIAGGQTAFDAQTSFIGSSVEARSVIDKYLGRPISDKEFNQLIAATSAEAGSNEIERAWVAGVILNRTRTHFGKADTITDVLYAKNQFAAVTGNKTDLYSNGPTEVTAQSIYAAIIKYLPSVGKKYLFFTAANLNAYGPSDDSTAIERLKKQPSSQIKGATIFSETNLK